MRLAFVWWWKEFWHFPFPYLFHRYDVMENRYEDGRWSYSWGGSAFRLRSAEDQKVFIEVMIENRELRDRLEALGEVVA